MITVQEAQAEAIRMVFEAVNEAGATPEALQFQYMQMLPKLAENPANKVLVVPADMAGLAGLATSLTQVGNQNVQESANEKSPAALAEGKQPGNQQPALQQSNGGAPFK